MTQSDHRHKGVRAARKRRIAITILVVLAAFLLVTVVGAIHASVRAQAVNFTVNVIQPDALAYCPGDSVTYDVDVRVTHYPAVIQITETWCEKGLTGHCSAALSRTWNQAVLEPRQITAQASRPIPDNPFFQAGKTYQLYHAVIDGRPEWYIVDNIKIKDTCP